MPCIKVLLNDERLSVGGGRDIDLLILSLIASKTGSAPQLNLSGMKKITNNKSEHLEWLREKVNYSDRIRVVVLESATPDTPISRATAETTSLEEIAGKKQNEIVLDTANSFVLRGSHPSFEITMSNSIHLQADIEEEEVLQLVFALHGQNSECRFDVESLTVMEDGYTKGRHWIDGNLRSNDWMEIKIINEPA